MNPHVQRVTPYAGNYQNVVSRVVIRITAREGGFPRRPVLPAYAQIHGQLLRDLPLILEVEVVNPFPPRWKKDRIASRYRVRPIQKETGKGVGKTDFGVAIEWRRAFRENEASACINRLLQIVTLAANVDTPFDD